MSKKYLIILFIGLAIGWLSGFGWIKGSFLESAIAQVPDSGAQRERTNKELSSLNRKMDELLTLLKSGQLKVICLAPDNQGIRTEPHETRKKQGR